MGPKANDSCPCKKREIQIQGHSQGEGHVQTEAERLERCIYSPREAKDGQSPTRSLEGARKDPSQRLQGRHGLAGTLISDFSFQSCERINFYCSKPPRLW